MAGISLSLRRVLSRDSYGALASGYLYGAIAIAGPGLLVSATVFAIQAAQFPAVSIDDKLRFQTLLIYAYAGSLILTGLTQLVVARFLSDRIFRKETGEVTPTYVTSCWISLTLQGAAAALFVWATGTPWRIGLAMGALLATLGLLWQSLGFLGVLRSYLLISLYLLLGAAIGLVAAVGLGKSYGLAGMIYGYAVGPAIVVGLLSARIRAEFPPARVFQPGLVAAFREHGILALLGVVWNMGLWIDKILFWYGPNGVEFGPGLRSCPLYDTPVFLAYVTALPAFAVLFIRIEASFFEKYTTFFDAIRAGADLKSIQHARSEMEISLRLTLERIVLIQGPLTLVAIVAAPHLFAWLRLDPALFYIFRIAAVGALLQTMLFAVMLACLHLALYRLALGIAATYLVLCGGLSGLTAVMGWAWYGYGQVGAALIALTVGVPLLLRRVGAWDRHTFMSQPC